MLLRGCGAGALMMHLLCPCTSARPLGRRSWAHTLSTSPVPPPGIPSGTSTQVLERLPAGQPGVTLVLGLLFRERYPWCPGTAVPYTGLRSPGPPPRPGSDSWGCLGEGRGCGLPAASHAHCVSPTDLAFITTATFLWKVSAITVVSCLPLYVLKYLKRKLSPPSYSKLTS